MIFAIAKHYKPIELILLFLYAFSPKMGGFFMAACSFVTIESAFAYSAGLEAIFYGSLKVGSQQIPRFVEWIQKTTAANYCKIQAVFNIANAASILYYAKMFKDELIRNYSFSILHWLDSALVPYLGWFVIGTSVAFIGVGIIYHYSSSREQPEIGEMKVSENPGFQQQFARFLHVTRLTCTLALTYFAVNKFWLVVSMGSALYSFFKCSKIKWMNFSRRFNLAEPIQEQEHFYLRDLLRPVITAVKVTYNMLTLETDPSSVNEECAICLEPRTDTAFCVNHLFHKACLSNMINEKSQFFARGTSYRYQDTQHYTNGRYTHTSREYSVEVPSQNLPSCPLCRAAPSNNSFDVTVSDKNYGDYSASVKMT